MGDQESPEPPNKSSHFNFSDSIGIVSLVVAILLWVLLPTLLGRAIGTAFAATGAVLLVYRSHWTYSLNDG
jgi:drug/metabolite transporter superfamily protein YnfA